MAVDPNDQNLPFQNASRRQRLSFSLAIQSTIGKRKSFVRPPTPPPNCEERIHYPVFNPRDPRHNPSATPSSWNGSGYDVPQAPSPRDSFSWMQSLPGRSLRKARSGFLALRSGMHRNPPPRNLHHRGNIPSIWSSSDSGEGSFDTHDDDYPETISEASTEEDFGFGFGLYRTRCNCSSALVGDPEGYLLKGPPITLAGPGRLPVTQTGGYSSAESRLDEPMLDTSDSGNTSAQAAKESIERRKARWFDDFVSRLSSRGDVSSSVSKSSSSSYDNSDIPKLDVSMRMKSLQVSDKPPTGSIEDSSLSAAKSSEDVPPEPTDSVDRTSSKEEEETQAPSPQEPANTEDTIDPEMHHLIHQQKPEDIDIYTQDGNETNTDIVSRLSYRPDLLDAWVSNRSNRSSTEEEDRDSSVSPSMHSNSHSETLPSTGPTSVSVSNRNPSSMDEDILSLTSISMKDEYFLMDGKTSHMHPGGGDNAIKAERSLTSDGNLSCFDRSPQRSEHACEIVGPGGPVIQRRVERSGGIRRDNSDSSADEYLVTYSMWQRYCPD